MSATLLGANASVKAGFLGVLASLGWLQPALGGLILLFPLVWCQMRTRGQAAALITGYWLPLEAALFLSLRDYWPALSLTVAFAVALAAFIVHGLPWLIAFGPTRPGLRLGLVCLLTALPPLGFITYAHPLLGLGALTNGLLPPWAALLGLGCAPLVLAVTARFWRPVAVFMVCISLSGWWLLPTATPSAWAGITPAVHRPTLSADHLLALMALRRAIHQHPAQYVLTPEAIAGRWVAVYYPLFDSAGLRQRQRGAWIGAEVWDADGQAYDNALIGIGVFEGLTLRQGIPAPGALWKPWQPPSARATGLPGYLSTPALSALICYEQVLLLSYVAAAVQHRGRGFVLLAPSSVTWNRSGVFTRLQRTAVQLGARLFGIPVVTAQGQETAREGDAVNGKTIQVQAPN